MYFMKLDNDNDTFIGITFTSAISNIILTYYVDNRRNEKHPTQFGVSRFTKQYIEPKPARYFAGIISKAALYGYIYYTLIKEL